MLHYIVSTNSNKFQKNICVKNNTGNQAVSLRSFALFRSAVPVGAGYFVGKRISVACPSVPQSARQYSVSQPKKRAGSHYPSSPSSSHALFLRSSGLLQPQYRFIPFRYAPLHSSRICVCRPLFFQRLLLRTAIGVGSVSTLP